MEPRLKPYAWLGLLLATLFCIALYFAHQVKLSDYMEGDIYCPRPEHDDCDYTGSTATGQDFHSGLLRGFVMPNANPAILPE